MKENVYLGKIAGIRIGMNWSLLFVIGLLAWSLAGGRFPTDYPGYTDSYYWAAGLIAVVILFASLLAHEMGHAIVARRQGVGVEGITLWLFGGVAKLKSDALTSSAELKIAIAGPIVSLVLAGVFAGTSAILDATGGSALIVGLVAWLWIVNAMLAIFNMVPAFPLDGGRVFRALVWRFKGKTKATKIAARTGRGFGYLMMSAGALEFTLNQGLDGIWIAFLGYFLVKTATTEEQIVITRDALVGVTVRDAMSTRPSTAPGWITVDEFVTAHVAQSHDTHFAVTDFDGKVTGVVSVEAIKALKPEDRATTRIDRVASPLERIIVTDPDESLTDLVLRLGAAGVGRALVYEDGNLVGTITGGDINRAIDMAELAPKTPT